ncbi:hypothetical protein HJC23_012181, partial [Cyclotella cryptica]
SRLLDVGSRWIVLPIIRAKRDERRLFKNLCRCMPYLACIDVSSDNPDASSSEPSRTRRRANSLFQPA